MIARIKGKVAQKGTNNLLIEVNGLYYEVFLPAAVMQGLDESIRPDGNISLLTYHYLPQHANAHWFLKRSRKRIL
jgi:Holliday junction resolvasome RuvABC DNA-binding subunit